jgi:hypothetical protein
MSLLSANRRVLRFIRLAMLMACAAVALGNLAHAGHFHKEHSTGHEQSVCQLCLQFDRSAPPPSVASIRAPSFLIALLALPSMVLPRAISVTTHYRARAPPHH